MPILEIVITLQRTLIIVFSLTISGEEGLRSSLDVVISSQPDSNMHGSDIYQDAETSSQSQIMASEALILAEHECTARNSTFLL